MKSQGNINDSLMLSSISTNIMIFLLKNNVLMLFKCRLLLHHLGNDDAVDQRKLEKKLL